MLDIKFIRENPDAVKKGVKDRNYAINIDGFLKLDKGWRLAKKKIDELRQKRNSLSEQINKAKKKGGSIKPLIQEAKKIPNKIKELEQKTEELKNKINSILFSIPNIPDKSVPVGDESKNKVIRKWGALPKFNFPVKNHVELLESLDILDMKRGAKLAGSGFYLFKGDLAKLERALIQFMMDFHVKNGFMEINPPQLANKKTISTTGNLPKFENDLYKTQDSFYLIPTAEVPLTNLHAEETLQENELPKRYAASTQCYRTEAGRHGSETPGIFRLHQFEKVEMVCICKPENSQKFLEEMTKRAEKILEMLKLPYKTILLSTEDMGFASAKTYDIEVWSPALKKYLETSSVSNCLDFQARRMNTKYIDGNNERKLVHTLNGSGLALPRLLISLVENYQQKDGSIKIPAVLQKYIGMKKIEKKK